MRVCFCSGMKRRSRQRLGAEAIMLQAQQIAHLFEQLFRLARRSGRRYNLCGHERVFIRHLPGKQTDYTDFICL